MDIFSFWGVLGVKNGRSNLEDNQNEKKIFFPTGNDVLQLFKVSARNSKKKRSHSTYPGMSKDILRGIENPWYEGGDTWLIYRFQIIRMKRRSWGSPQYFSINKFKEPSLNHNYQNKLKFF